ncbi:MAG: hypothetical protein JWM19_163 [Actinomycetia bacterium]|nr:hypothetical protein [Actinomycetes bacterium]
MNNRRIGLAACGVIVALVAAGCGSSSTSGNSAATGGSDATAAPSPSNTQPAWAKSLGPGVTVTGSSSATAGDGSPAGVFLTAVRDIPSGHFADMCPTVEPSQQAACKSQLGSVPVAGIKAYLPTYKNLATTYTAIDGDKALVGSTGSVCGPSATTKCTTNTDPAAIFDSSKSFATLWNEAMNSKNNGYGLSPLIKVNGTWYGYSF